MVADASMNPDDVESAVVQKLVGKSPHDGLKLLEESVFTRIATEIDNFESITVATVRSSLSAWWRVLGNCIDCALSVTTLKESHLLLRIVHSGFQLIGEKLRSMISRGGIDADSKDSSMIQGPYFLAYTSAVRASIESIHCIADPMLGCDILLGLEAFVPMDNKGISNVYKKYRQADDDDIRSILESVSAGASVESFEEGGVTLENPSKGFEKFWTMMEVSRRLESELLTDTKSWGRFSQSASVTLNLIGDQIDALDSASCISTEPLEYACKENAFSIQMSSASFRRRAVLNIIFTCAHVSQNSSNALITAAAKTLLNTTLKSMPLELQTAMNTLIRFDSHWVSWKAGASREVCPPFLKRSRIERGMEPFGEELIDLTTTCAETPTAATDDSLGGPSTPDASESVPSTNIFAVHAGDQRSESLKRKIIEYREYVKDAILCDISDDAEKDRLGSSDSGMEEAMRNNNDRVLLWQFRRMRFNTDLKSFLGA